jgi:hypothetical protein
VASGKKREGIRHGKLYKYLVLGKLTKSCDIGSNADQASGGSLVNVKATFVVNEKAGLGQ